MKLRHLFLLLLCLLLSHAPANARHKKHKKGLAGYYAQKFNGRKTASGEIFDNNAYTAACNAYPFGTYIAVTNQQNGKTVCVKVTDRIANKARLIDLTVAAAKYIDMIKSGVVKVTVKKLKPSKGEALISEQMQPQ